MRIDRRFPYSALAVLLGLLPIVLACSGGVRTVSPQSDPGSPAGSSPNASIPVGSGTSSVPTASANQPDVEMPVKNFVKEVRASPFLEAYRDRSMKVTGTVEWYGYGLKDEAFLLLKDGDQTRFNCKDRLPIRKALAGQTVTLRGKAGFSILWEIVEVSGQGPPEISVEQMTKDLAADAKATDLKWKDKIILLTGQIHQIRGGLLLTPVGQKPEILCRHYTAFPEIQKERDKGFQVGKKVKMLGQWQVPSRQLGMCELIEVLP